MIDLHCHILPGVDDGPLDFHTAVRMAEIAARDGIETIVATPHVKDAPWPASRFKALVGQLNTCLDKSGIPVRIVQGGDVSALNEPDTLQDFTINNSRYILIEFPHSYMPNNSRDILFNLSVRGFCPIITHPERNLSVMQNPDKFLGILNGNALVQITAGSLTGEFGRNEKSCALHLLRKGVVSFIATDAHSADFRKPILSAGLKVAQKVIGMEKARKLVTDNPSAVLHDLPVVTD